MGPVKETVVWEVSLLIAHEQDYHGEYSWDRNHGLQ